jgi:hypothetical protein
MRSMHEYTAQYSVEQQVILDGADVFVHSTLLSLQVWLSLKVWTKVQLVRTLLVDSNCPRAVPAKTAVNRQCHRQCRWVCCATVHGCMHVSR